MLMTISGPVPQWATQSKLDNLTRPSPSAFAAFVTAVGRKFGDQVDTWAIWNEPNQPQFLRPQYAKGGRATSPGIYRNLYLAGVRGLRKSGQGDEKILLAETSPRGNSNVVHPLRFMRAMLCLDAKYKKRSKCSALPADGYAHHAYTTRQGPFFTPPNKDDVTIGVLSRLTKALDRARSAGALTKRLPIYLTEFGIQSTPDLQQGVSLKQQVQYRAISERTAWNNPRVIAFSQYLLTDSAPTGPESVRRLRVGAALLGRQAEAVAGRLPPPARRQADRLEGLDLGPRATGDRRDDGDDHVRRPRRRLQDAAHGQDRRARLLHGQLDVAQRPALESHLGGPVRLARRVLQR